MTEPTAINALLEVMRRLRDPDTGCPWDKEQTFATIAPYTVEESYEVADAIARDDMGDLKEELGDLLFQVVFHSRIAEEAGLFNFDDVARGMADKLIRRHPHVFGDVSHRTADEQTVAWEAVKAEERKAKDKGGILDDVPIGLPALTRAAKLTKRAARVGFDWPSVDEVLDKLDEETMALARHIASQPPQQIASGKAMFHAHMAMDLEQAYAYATDFMAGALQREDPQTGIDAFVGKKPKPEWKGR